MIALRDIWRREDGWISELDRLSPSEQSRVLPAPSSAPGAGTTALGLCPGTVPCQPEQPVDQWSWHHHTVALSAGHSAKSP
uniref:Uncharacterized protein n=1 Tax=Knipowitschia caucasica TaxID=637954 RepID=A0AAV2LV11_KNICA